MKTIEEKARAYDEALEKAREYWETDNDNTLDIKAKGTMEYLFPELAKSGDEIIKEELINYLKHRCNSTTLSGEERACNKWIDWLEKQDSNLVENGYTNNKDVIKYADNYSHAIWHKLMDNFKNIKDYHIGCNDVSDIVLNAIINTYNWIEKQGEQKSAEWSEEDETKIKSIITFLKSPSLCAMNGNKGIIDENIKYLKSLKDRVQPEQEWSEDDEQYLLVCKNALRKYQITNKWDSDIISRWLDNKLKSLRPQINVTDEELAQAKKEAYNEVLDKIEYHDDWPTFDDGWSAAIWYLKKRNGIPQNRWKPTDEQMKALKEACDKSWEPDGLDPLYTLYEDLKKLKEEQVMTGEFDSYYRVKGYLGIAFMNYLDSIAAEGKMCLSNMECADIDKAFNEQDWAKIERYIRKYKGE